MQQSYYIDFEFLEGKQDKTIFGIKYGQTKNTIDPISVGIISNDNREYYAVFKDFNLKEAWNRYDLIYNTGRGDANNLPPKKVYWIRENVLKPIFNQWLNKEINLIVKASELRTHYETQYSPEFCYKSFKYLLNKYGKPKEQIAKEIKTFIGTKETIGNWEEIKDKMNTNLYGYYSDFDFVCLTWLFGKMIDLPDGFPKYMIDLKQILDEKVGKMKLEDFNDIRFIQNDSDFSFKNTDIDSFDKKLKLIKSDNRYPKQTNEHSALFDATFNKELHEFLNTL